MKNVRPMTYTEAVDGFRQILPEYADFAELNWLRVHDPRVYEQLVNQLSPEDRERWQEVLEGLGVES